MESNSSSSYQGNNDPNLMLPENSKRSQVQLNSEELRILRECNRESFYYRCLPFAVTGMALTYMGFKRGILSGHPRWGPALKMTAAAFTGWFLGKISYRSKCEEKFVNVKNSTIADVVRKKRGYISETFDREGSQFSSDNNLTLKDNNYSSDSSGDYHSSSGSLNFDKNVPFSELDDRDRPSMDNENDNLSERPQSKVTATTYENLRNRNREEYERQYRQPETPKTDFRRPWNQTNFEPQNRSNVDSREDIPKNLYGDSWDNPKFT